MRFLSRLSIGLDRCVSRLTLAFAWLALPLLIGVTLVHVIGRQFGDVGSGTLYELGSELFFALVMLSFGYAYLRDGHVRIDILRDRMRARWLAWIELVGCLAVLMPLSGYLIVYGGESAWRAFAQGERSGALMDLPLGWIMKATVPLGFLLLLLAGASVAGRNGLFLLGREDGPAPGGKA